MTTQGYQVTVLVNLSKGRCGGGDIRKNYSGIRKVERVLGWRPEVDLSSGLRKTWAWFEA